MSKVIYTSPMCGPCHIIKNRLAARPDLDVTLVDITKEDFPRDKVRSVPTLIDGDEIIVGAPVITKHLGL